MLSRTKPSVNGGALVPTVWSALGLIVLVVLSIISFPGHSFGQAIDGNLVGTVVDQTSATLPNAEVELENVATGVKNTTRTGMDGLYRFNNLPVGTYMVTVKASGFADTAVKNVVVELNKTTTANVTMQVQGVTTEVAV